MSEQKLDGTKMMYHAEALARWQKGDVVYPIQIEISPTQHCNHKCSFCYYEYTARSNQFLDRDVWDKLITEARPLGTKALFYSGEGEPMLHQDLPDLVERAADLEYDQALNTNATALVPKKIKRILPHLEWMRVSVNGLNAEDYARVHVSPLSHFELALTNVAKAVEFKAAHNLTTTIGIQFVYTGQKLDDLLTFAQRLKEIGVSYFSIKPGMPHPDNPNFKAAPFPSKAEMEPVLSLATDGFQVAIRWGLKEQDWTRPYKKCLSLPFFAEVTADGKVYACGPHLGEEDFSYGSLHDMGIKEMWSHENRAKVENHVCSIDNLDHVCMPLCRLDQVNRFLWDLENPPPSVNFI